MPRFVWIRIGHVESGERVVNLWMQIKPSLKFPFVQKYRYFLSDLWHAFQLGLSRSRVYLHLCSIWSKMSFKIRLTDLQWTYVSRISRGHSVVSLGWWWSSRSGKMNKMLMWNVKKVISNILNHRLIGEAKIGQWRWIRKTTAISMFFHTFFR